MTDLVRESEWTTTGASKTVKRPRVAPIFVHPKGSWGVWVPLFFVSSAVSLMGFGILLPLDAVFRFFLFAVAFFSVLAAPFSTRVAVNSNEPEEPTEFDLAPLKNGRHVTINIWQGDALTGEDHGALWFEDGRLYFAGTRTSFGIFPSQVRGQAKIRRGLMEDHVQIVLRRDTAVGPMRVTFRLRPYRLNAEFAHRASLRTDLDVWIKESAEGEGQYPPAKLGPGLPSEKRLLAEAVLLTFPPALTSCALLTLLMPSHWETWLVGSLFVFAGMVPAGNLRWRALRDRRRLRRRL